MSVYLVDEGRWGPNFIRDLVCVKRDLVCGKRDLVDKGRWGPNKNI